MKLAAPWLDDPATATVMNLLTRGGHGAWFVGGCVRNALLGLDVADIDIATDLRPDDVMALAQDAGVKVVPTGIDHGTVTLIADHRPFEVTTLRRDVATDGRRATIAFTADLDTTSTLLEIVELSANRAVLRPLDPGLSPTALAGRPVRFIEAAW